MVTYIRVSAGFMTVRLIHNLYLMFNSYWAFKRALRAVSTEAGEFWYSGFQNRKYEEFTSSFDSTEGVSIV